MTSTIDFEERTVVNPLIKDRATFIETASDSNGSMTLIRIELAPGGGNGLHYHKSFDETFNVLEGQLGVQIDDDILYLGEGDSATVKAGSMHRFFNASNEVPATFQVMLQPGHQGFERTIQVAYGLAADGLSHSNSMPKNLYHLALLVYWSDTNSSGIYRLFEPIFNWLARRAIRKGIDQVLIKRYCKF